MSMIVTEHEIVGRLRHAMLVASKSRADTANGNGYADVRIHVGPEVADALKALCTVKDTTIPLGARVGGFDLIPEADWEPGRIVVRTDREIF